MDTVTIFNLAKYALGSTGESTPKNARLLNTREMQIAQKVFGKRIPYEHVLVTDAIGAQGRPFTIPVPGSRYYSLNVGAPAYSDMSQGKIHAETLVHELVHVWQGVHSSWSYAYVFRSAWHQIRSGESAYTYDKATAALEGSSWGDYNPEQQAQIIEDWFSDGMKGEYYDRLTVLDRLFGARLHEKQNEYDPRLRFVYTNIRGVPLPLIAQPIDYKITPRYSQTARESLPPVTDDYLTGLLAKRFAANDMQGARQRVADLEQAFNELDRTRAKSLLGRLERPNNGEALAKYFRDHLSPPSHTRLLNTLRRRAR
jgi:hypothetical protein